MVERPSLRLHRIETPVGGALMDRRSFRICGGTIVEQSASFRRRAVGAGRLHRVFDSDDETIFDRPLDIPNPRRSRGLWRASYSSPTPALFDRMKKE